MKVIVTGASGFLGSWICRVLSTEYDVIALIQNESSTKNLDGIQNLKFHRDEVSNWPKYIEKIVPHSLVLSDWWGVGNAYRNDQRQFENVPRFEALVRSAVSADVRKILGVGSQAELGPVSQTILENQVDSPTTLYGTAKVEARKLLFDLTENSNTSATWMRIFSTYGPLDYGQWLIPDTINALSEDREMNLTPGLQEWSYLHAFDLGLAFLKILNCPESIGIVNVGNPQTCTIKEVTQLIGSYFAKTELLNYGAIPYRTDQVMQLKPACETLIDLGWSPKVSIQEGILQTIEWNIGVSSASLLEARKLNLELNLPHKTKL